MVLLLLVVGVIAGVAGTSGCRKSAPITEASAEAPVVTDTTTGLMLTWIDDKGEFHNELRVADVPASGRDLVRVRVLESTADPSADRVFVSDLRTAGPAGAYPVRAVPRAEFEDAAVARRAKNGSVLTPKAAASVAAGGSGAGAGAGGAAGAPAGSGAPGEGSEHPAVIIYGASWCGPCHQAAAYLKQRGVAFVEHDIERDSSAAREMQTKLTKAGIRGGSIPVLDVRGKILVGFDARAVDRALGQPL